MNRNERPTALVQPTLAQAVLVQRSPAAAEQASRRISRDDTRVKRYRPFSLQHRLHVRRAQLIQTMLAEGGIGSSHLRVYRLVNGIERPTASVQTTLAQAVLGQRTPASAE